ncbi:MULTISPECIES: integrase arm-type DNA-binding domain-containing protein [unclassified Variovorax]|uniref:tyrosine-type recombinase/integrase n=1 Tax=unclassified Variovorax TaxID=663243 RepID=UPI00076D519A|nr:MULTISPECIES: integrase arm-type DNA-binding domain-containing protein [unclassified Variovorax]KWT83713.1 putative integrase [Variovorax sp. WDL1]PNG46391.1 putative prophage CPS-53 integrase [Variovorax sp. B2]PNG47787.1 putative prophage CPS-53 integrase [Variovorax sp. B4]VTV14126.1 Putative prophage CPS-53 integrase [Variovorax sp. WDL1]
MKLTDAKLRNLTTPGRHFDGGGLYLEITTAGGRYWRMKYRFAGKEKRLAFGVYPDVALKEARAKREAAKLMLGRGEDPGAAKKAAKARVAVEAANSFQAVALDWHKANAKRWAEVTAAKMLKHLEADVFPVIGSRPIASITAPELLAMLRKVEARGAAYTATRLREVCGQVFRYGIATGRATYNPAGDLERAILTPDTKHRPAITDRREFGVFLRDLKSYQAADPLTLLATRMALLTFLRSQELRLARWNEIDFDACEWRVPAARMKMGKGLNQAHVVPLSQPALDTLRELHALTGDTPSLFPNRDGADGFMSENTIGRMLIRMGHQGRQTLHGFRASARSLLSERGWTVAALERQLDHAERSKVVAAYARSEHLEERRRIMDDWGAIVVALESGENVVPLRRAA